MSNMLTPKSREERLAALLTRAIVMLPDTPEAAALRVDAQEYMIDLLATQFDPGEAPPGVEQLQQDVTEAVLDDERKARNRRKAGRRPRVGKARQSNRRPR